MEEMLLQQYGLMGLIAVVGFREVTFQIKRRRNGGDLSDRLTRLEGKVDVILEFVRPSGKRK